MVAFKQAVTQGCDMIEIDLHLSEDRELVVIHDDTLDRTTNQTGRVRDYTLEELKKADVGAGQHVPSFQEVIDFLPEKVGLVVKKHLKKKRTGESSLSLSSPFEHVITRTLLRERFRCPRK